jgi:cyclohexanone monooxygenase
VVIVGAGLAGLYQLYRLRALGFTTRVFEAGGDVGGTWYWNRYPGARCDVESLEYSYSFSPELEQEWEWTERYPGQPEILSYIRHVADRFELRDGIEFETRVVRSEFDEDQARWRVRTDRDTTVVARFLILATGCLSVPKTPEFAGLDSFPGQVYYTSRWPHEPVDFSGQRVAVVGTGSSGVQSIPVIAEQAASLTVFQRTPNFSLPARNAPLGADVQRRRKQRYREFRELARHTPSGLLGPLSTESALAADPDERREVYERAWAQGSLGALRRSYMDLGTDLAANETAAEFIRSKIREVVHDPEVAELLSPRDHPFGTKRPCLDTNYYQTYNLGHVRLVNLRATPIQEITPRGIRTTEEDHEFDSIVFATGFDAVTGALLAIDIRGRAGTPLAEVWADGPKSYLGLGMAGFPNLFTITGPGSPSVLSNMIVSIEQHVDWITDCLRHLCENGVRTIEASEQAEQEWGRHVVEVGETTLYPKANSWYMGANVPGKPRVFLPYIGGVGVYRQTCDKVAAQGYSGFVLGR